MCGPTFVAAAEYPIVGVAETHSADTKNLIYKQNLKKIGYLSAFMDSQRYLNTESMEGTASSGCVKHAMRILVLTDHLLPGDEQPKGWTAVAALLIVVASITVAEIITVGWQPPGREARDKQHANLVGNTLADGVAGRAAMLDQVSPDDANITKERFGQPGRFQKRIVATHLDRFQDSPARAKHFKAHMNLDLVMEKQTRKQRLQRLGQNHAPFWQGDHVSCTKCQQSLLGQIAMRWVPQQCTLIILPACPDVQRLGPARKPRLDQIPRKEKQHAQAHVVGLTGLERPVVTLHKEKQHVQAFVAGLAGPERPFLIPLKENQHVYAYVAGRLGPLRPVETPLLGKQHAFAHGAGLEGPRKSNAWRLAEDRNPMYRALCGRWGGQWCARPFDVARQYLCARCDLYDNFGWLWFATP